MLLRILSRRYRNPNIEPISMRMSQTAWLLSLLHKQHLGILMGMPWGICIALAFYFSRGSLWAYLFPIVVVVLFTLECFLAFKKALHFRTFNTHALAVADEYEMHLQMTSLGSLVRSAQAEASGEIFVRGKGLSDADKDAIAKRVTDRSAARSEAIAKFAEAARLIDEGLETWVGRYTAHSLQQLQETLEVIAAAENNRTMKIQVEVTPKTTKGA